MAKYSPRFQGSNQAGARDLFKQRQYYRNRTTALFGDIPNSLDLWYEAPYYGRVDLEGNLIVARKDTLKYGGNYEAILVDFVFDAFQDFRRYLNQSAQRGRTTLSKTLFGNFIPKKTYTDPIIKYFNYGAQIMTVFNNQLTTGKKIVSTMEGYIEEFLSFFEQITNIVTFSAFYGSSQTDIYSTGLAIDLLGLDASNDAFKNKIFKSDEFNIYVQSAANFGFRVDKNVPWRLVADIKAPRMQQYYIKYNLPNAQMVFKNRFQSALMYDVYGLLILFQNGYRSYQRKRQFGFKTIHCFKPDLRFKNALASNVVSQMKRIDFEKMPYQTALKQFVNVKMLKTLASIKFREVFPHYNFANFKVFQTKFFNALKSSRDSDPVTMVPRALQILTHYYNPSRIYRHGFADEPYYFDRLPPSPAKKILTYKENIATLYKTHVTIPGPQSVGDAFSNF